MVDRHAKSPTLADAQDGGATLGSVGLELGGRWRLVAPIGAGGMGEVWRAVHRDLGREAAVKLLTAPSVANRARMLREARILASIRHDAVVEVFDVGEHGNVPFFVMGWVEGETLARRVEREGPMPPRELVRAFAPILDGLAAVHQTGIVHRDVKPDNVLVTRRSDGSTRLVLIDFGIAQLGVADTKLTATGALVGTPEYMAPEVLRGLEADVRADVWGAAATLYEGLSGVSPFRREHFVATVRAVTEDEPAPLGDLPEELELCVRRGLAKALDARFPSAPAMRDALTAWLAGAMPPIERGLAPTQHAGRRAAPAAPPPAAPLSQVLPRPSDAAPKSSPLDALIQARFGKS